MSVKLAALAALMVAFVLLAGPPAVYPGHKPNHNPGGGGGGGSEVDPAILTIRSATGDAVSDDEDVYVDQLVVANETPDPCVVATVSNTGLFWADMVADAGNCSPSDPSRTYFLTFPGDSTNPNDACSILQLDESTGLCEINAQRKDGDFMGNARIRAFKMFKERKNSTADIAFLFVHKDGNSYEVQADQGVPVIFSDDGLTAEATYSGTATLVRIAGPNTGPVAGPFSFPFELTVTRCPDGICP